MKRCEEMGKDKIVEAQEAIQERNALLLQKTMLAREVDELKEKMASNELALVDEQIHWEETLAKFNPSLKINFDTSGVPPSVSHAADATAVSSLVEETIITAPEPVAAYVPPTEA
ncbi:unnamed protein product [Prunus armeniaca]